MEKEKTLSAKDIAWQLFKRTGEMRYYNLYKALEE